MSGFAKKAIGQNTTLKRARTLGPANQRLLANQKLRGNQLARTLGGDSLAKIKTELMKDNSRIGELQSRIAKIKSGSPAVKNVIASQIRRNASLHQLIEHNRKRNHVCIDRRRWCDTKPKCIHWWYKWCPPLRYCEPADYVRCSWNYVVCDYSSGGHVVAADARWYLGIKGMLLAGQGVGIEEITAGSPAAAVGLQPGMVITRCNGIDLVDETALGDVITQSNGVLQMDLLINSDTPATCVVVMHRVASHSY